MVYSNTAGLRGEMSMVNPVSMFIYLRHFELEQFQGPKYMYNTVCMAQIRGGGGGDGGTCPPHVF